MGKYSPEYLQKTIAVWQPHFEKTLNLADAQEIADNVLGLFSVILKSELELNIPQTNSNKRGVSK